MPGWDTCAGDRRARGDGTGRALTVSRGAATGCALRRVEYRDSDAPEEVGGDGDERRIVQDTDLLGRDPLSRQELPPLTPGSVAPPPARVGRLRNARHPAADSNQWLETRRGLPDSAGRPQGANRMRYGSQDMNPRSRSAKLLIDGATLGICSSVTPNQRTSVDTSWSAETVGMNRPPACRCSSQRRAGSDAVVHIRRPPVFVTAQTRHAGATGRDH